MGGEKRPAERAKITPGKKRRASSGKGDKKDRFAEGDHFRKWRRQTRLQKFKREPRDRKKVGRGCKEKGKRSVLELRSPRRRRASIKPKG